MGLFNKKKVNPVILDPGLQKGTKVSRSKYAETLKYPINSNVKKNNNKIIRREKDNIR